MAKIHKLTMYIVDPEEYINNEEDIEDMFDRTDCFTHHINLKSSNSFIWDDKLPINYIKCPKEDCEKYFE